MQASTFYRSILRIGKTCYFVPVYLDLKSTCSRAYLWCGPSHRLVKIRIAHLKIWSSVFLCISQFVHNSVANSKRTLTPSSPHPVRSKLKYRKRYCSQLEHSFSWFAESAALMLTWELLSVYFHFTISFPPPPFYSLILSYNKISHWNRMSLPDKYLWLKINVSMLTCC